MKSDHEKTLRMKIDRLKRLNKALVGVLKTIKGRARSIVEDREDVTKTAFRIVLDVEHAIAKTKKS